MVYIRGLANNWIKVIFLADNNVQPTITSCPTQPPSLVEFPKVLSWVLYIINLTHSSKTPRFILFADDTKILFSHSVPEILESLINTEL